MADKLQEYQTGQIYVATDSIRRGVVDHEDVSFSNVLSSFATSAFSPGIESNPDSCYDSDASSAGSRRNSAQVLDVGGHDEICRKMSETLAAEYTESDHPKARVLIDHLPCHVPVMTSPSFPGPRPPPHVEPLDGLLLETNTEHAAKVEFGLRLGYNEDEVLSALNKVGYKVSDDELLSELIQAGEGPEGSEEAPKQGPDEGPRPLEDEETIQTLEKRRLRATSAPGDDDVEELRPIVIDGSNVAMSHGNKDVFSCMGIKLAVDWFQERGHKEITVFVPTWRKETSRPDTPITNQELLLELEKENIVVFTPARRIGGKRVICYDDRYIVKLAADNGGIVVSNDNYRDLLDESADYKKVIEERLLMYSFVNDRFMPPDDPMGRYGPSLSDFLMKRPRVPKTLPPICPYGKKCTYGNKCKYYHPERGQQPVKLVTEKLVEKARKALEDVKKKGHLGPGDRKSRGSSDQSVKSSLTRSQSQVPGAVKQTLARTQSLHPGQSFPVKKGTPITLAQFMNLPKDENTGGSREEVHSQVSVSITTDSHDDSDDATSTESHDYLKYNDRLSQLRRKVEAADADERNRMALSEGDLASPDLGRVCEGNTTKHKSDPTVVKNKRTAGHWSLMHDSLRPVNSDPQIPGPFSGGHLSLAKKLSDEGKSTENRMGLVGRGLSPGRLSPTSCVSRPCAVSPEQDQHHVRHHKTLQRQLSLKGSDDPRLCHGMARFNTLPVIQTENREQPDAPTHTTTQSHWSSSDAPTHTTTQSHWSSSDTPTHTTTQSHWSSSDAPTHTTTQSHWSSSGHSVLGKNVSCPVTAIAGNIDGSPRQTDPPRENQMSEHFYQAHNSPGRKTGIPGYIEADNHFPVHRLMSDPVVPPANLHGHKIPTSYPKMTRQNSTSDPQLNVYHEEHGWPHVPGAYPMAETYRYELLRSSLEQSRSGIPLHMRTAPNSPHTPLSPHLGGQLQIPFNMRSPAAGLQGQTSHGSIPNVYSSSSTQSVASPVGYSTGTLTAQGHRTPGMAPQYRAGPPVQQPHSGFFLPSQAESPSPLMPGTGQDMSKPPPPILAHRGQDLTKPPPALVQSTGIRASFPQANIQQNIQPQLRGASPPHGIPPPANIQQRPPTQGLLLQHNPPITEPAWTATSKSTYQMATFKPEGRYPQISESDPRYNLYYHLCGLFKEEDVRRVMMEQPNETNPQLLCRFLI